MGFPEDAAAWVLNVELAVASFRRIEYDFNALFDRIGTYASRIINLEERLAVKDAEVLTITNRVQVLEDAVAKLTAPPPVVVPHPVVVEPPPVVVVPPPVNVVFREDWTKDPSQFVVEAPSSVGSVKIAAPGNLTCILSTEQPPNSNGKYKSEVYPRDPAVTTWKKFRSEPMGVPMEYDFSVRLSKPLDWTKAGSKILVAQLHGMEDADETGIGRNPNLSLSLETLGGNPSMVWRGAWDSNRTSTGNPNVTKLWVGSPVQDKWLNVHVEASWSYGPDGYLRITHTVDNVTTKAVEVLGPNAYNDQYGPYWVFGLYMPGLSDKTYSNLVVRPRQYEALYGPVCFVQK